METPPPRHDQSLGQWLMEPQTLIALSAVLIGACGLFISLYEASLMREEQRAAVWPRLSLGFTVNDTLVTFTARNAGVGPARVQAAAIRYKDSTMVNWSHLFSRVIESPIPVNQNVSLLNGGVLTPGEQTNIAVLDFREQNHARALAIATLQGDVDIRACYCSVYDDCWSTSLQDAFPTRRRLGINLAPDSTRSETIAPDSSPQGAGMPQPKPVSSCTMMDRSTI